MALESRAALGAVYRVTSDFLNERGLMADMKASLSQPSRAVLDKLPFAFSWQPYAALEEIETRLYAKSPQLSADLGFYAAKFLSGSVVAPVFKMALSLFGRTPDAIYGNLDRFFSMVVRGFNFRYEGGGEKQGRVVVSIEGGPVHPSLFQQIKGNLAMMYGICDADGTVDEPQVIRSDGEGAEIALGVHWK
ncbi:MAG TPA: hypothetical protein VLW85_13750 [Myxococcales bacterium]|nr:hypothetical protein [Myxococcales bacterium]